jgi:uncharacterized protein YajQ (UPF0234 family)
MKWSSLKTQVPNTYGDYSFQKNRIKHGIQVGCSQHLFKVIKDSEKPMNSKVVGLHNAGLWRPRF